MTTEHTQETKIAILEAKVEHMMGHVKELTLRVRANEKVVAIVSAVGIGAGGIIGSTAFAPDADAAPRYIDDFENGKIVYVDSREKNPLVIQETYNHMVDSIRKWKMEKERTPVEDMINSSLAEYKDGSNDTTESEELLQLSSSVDRQGTGWRHDRCHDRSWFRPIQKGESEDCWSRHSRKEDKESGRESIGS